jgi:hypothetical protein
MNAVLVENPEIDAHANIVDANHSPEMVCATACFSYALHWLGSQSSRHSHDPHLR